MKYSNLGIGLLLFAILLEMCSSGLSALSAGVPLGIKNFEVLEYRPYGLLLHRLDSRKHILKLPGYPDVLRVKYQNLLYKGLFQLFS